MSTTTVIRPQKDFPGTKLHDKVYALDGKVGVIVAVNRRKWWAFWRCDMLTIQMLSRYA